MASRHDARIIFTGPSGRGWHRLQLAAECMQKYAWKYLTPPPEPEPAREISMLLEPEGNQEGIPLMGTKSPALIKGSLIHLALAQRYKRMQMKQEGKDPEEWCEPLEAVELIAKLNGVTEHLPLLRKVYEAYDAHWYGEEDYVKVLDVECLFETQIAGRYRYTGRIDLLTETLDGVVHAEDHKTAGRINASQKEFYAVSGQLMGYSHLVREKYGDRYGGMKLNLIQVSADPRFERFDIARSPALESQFAQTVVDWEERIALIEASGRKYDHWPKAMNELSCFSRYGACEYIDQCRFGAGTKKGAGGSWSWEG